MMWTPEKLREEFDIRKLTMQNPEGFIKIWNEVIKDNWYRGGPGNLYVYIPDDVFEQAELMSKKELGKSWWAYSVCNHRFRKASEDKNKIKHSGIYGIYQNDELVYVGYTMRDFKDRWKEHCSIIEGKTKAPDNMILYKYLSDTDDITFKILIDSATIKVDNLKKRDWEAMELALITFLKPKYNYAGIRKNYKLSR